MSSLSGGCVGGCGLCGTETSPENTHFLTPEDFEIIQPLLLSCLATTSSEDSDLANNNNNKVDWTKGSVESCSQVVFCPDCQSLLKEMKRLKGLLKLVSSQLDTVVAKVRVKYNGGAGKGQAVGVKLEPIIYDDDNNNNLLLL